MRVSGKAKILFAMFAVIILIALLPRTKPEQPAGLPTTNDLVASEQTVNEAPHRFHEVAAMPPTNEETTGEEGFPKLSREKIEEYLARHNRNARSLLAAFHASGDTNYLNEAAMSFPGEPQVQFTILARNAFPEDRRKWLEAFKSSSPSNSLANYFSARDYFDNNQPDAAINEILAASGKSEFTDFTMETYLTQEELYRFAGKSPLEAAMAAMSAMSEDHLSNLTNFKGIAQGLSDVKQQYLTGDAASVENLSKMGMDLSDRLTSGEGGRFLISQLIGISAQAIALQSLEPNASYDFLNGKTPAQILDELKQQRASFRQLSKDFSVACLRMSEDEMVSYSERVKVYGELEAMRWLVQQSELSTPNTGN